MSIRWGFCYCKAINKDGSLLFPERLTQDFLDNARRTMGSYFFANQYQNEIIPDDEQTFKKEWRRYYKEIPEDVYRFAFVDPAISEADTADYTALTVAAVDSNKNWYIEAVRRERLNPSGIIELIFQTHQTYAPRIIGVEDVAFQRAIIHFAYEEMKRRGKKVPLDGVKRSPDKSKQMRILGLVPRFEWGTLLLGPNCQDLEEELDSFPRGTHDDVLDSLASIEDIVYYPQKKVKDEKPHPTSPEYESWLRERRFGRKNLGDSEQSGW